MNLQGIVAVSGKPGLWKALAQNKSGYVLESLDDQKVKMVANIATAKIAALNEITLFGLDEDIRLTEVFERMKNSANVPDAKADGKKLREFFREVAPDHDEEKVYASDIKKVVSWFHVLKDLPLFSEEEPGAAPAADESAVEEKPLAEEPVKKAKPAAKESNTETSVKPKAKKTTAKKV
jgi:hypothetical protein